MMLFRTAMMKAPKKVHDRAAAAHDRRAAHDNRSKH